MASLLAAVDITMDVTSRTASCPLSPPVAVTTVVSASPAVVKGTCTVTVTRAWSKPGMVTVEALNKVAMVTVYLG